MLKTFLILIIFTILSGCGGPTRIEKPNTNLSTLIEIVYLDTGNHVINFRLSHRQAENRTASMLACRLKVNEGDYNPLPTIQVPELTAYARERLSWKLPDNHSIPTQDRIEYSLDCSLKADKNRDEYFKSRGSLYRLGQQEPPIYR